MVRTCGTEPPSVNGGHLAVASFLGGRRELERRKPMLLLALSGVLLLRLATVAPVVGLTARCCSSRRRD